ncbi:hypothetical protein V2I01_41550 [Micromonospora sp. BRA006-A]|nr:hypothetical protein [Micromonospora sp. BRA006-A]
MVDLSGLTPLLATADWAQLPPAALAEAYRQVTSARLLLVATPTFKGSYTGLLAVRGPASPAGAGRDGGGAGDDRGARADQHAVDSHLRPLLLALDASVRCPGCPCWSRSSTGSTTWWGGGARRPRRSWPAAARGRGPDPPMLPDPSLLTFV